MLGSGAPRFPLLVIRAMGQYACLSLLRLCHSQMISYAMRDQCECYNLRTNIILKTTGSSKQRESLYILFTTKLLDFLKINNRSRHHTKLEAFSKQQINIWQLEIFNSCIPNKQVSSNSNNNQTSPTAPFATPQHTSPIQPQPILRNNVQRQQKSYVWLDLLKSTSNWKHTSLFLLKWIPNFIFQKRVKAFIFHQRNHRTTCQGGQFNKITIPISTSF